MRIIATILISCCTLLCKAQSIIWEKNENHNPIAEFNPRGFTVSASGSIYITGQYERGEKYFKVTDGNYTLADSTMPDIGLFGTMFVLKMSPNGKLIKREYATGLSSEYRKLKPEDFANGHTPKIGSIATGSSILATSNNGLLITGFVVDYREKHTPNDRGQGIFAAMMDTNLQLRWDKLYPSYYNSTPDKVIETQDGKFLIVGNTLAHSANAIRYYPEGLVATRILKINGKGEIATDTLLAALHLRDDHYEFYDTVFDHIYMEGEVVSVTETERGYLFSGTEKFQRHGNSGTTALLMETDKAFTPLKKKTYSLFKSTYSNYDFIGGNLAVGSNSLALTGVAQSAKPACFVAILNKDTYDTTSLIRTDGNVFSYPGIVNIGKNKYAVCLRDDNKSLKILFIENGKLTKTLQLKQQGIVDFIDMQLQDNYLYVLASCNRGCYIAKVSVK